MLSRRFGTFYLIMPLVIIQLNPALLSSRFVSSFVPSSLGEQYFSILSASRYLLDYIHSRIIHFFSFAFLSFDFFVFISFPSLTLIIILALFPHSFSFFHFSYYQLELYNFGIVCLIFLFTISAFISNAILR